MRRYSFSPEAQQDLHDIKKYLLKKTGVSVARYVLSELRRAMEFLAVTPGAGHSREDLANEYVKFWPVFSYLIVYKPETRPLEIVRVLHARRDITTLLDHG